MWIRLFERLALRSPRRARRLDQISRGQRPFHTHPNPPGETAPRALTTLLPILQASPRQGMIRARPAQPRRAAIRVHLSIGPRRLILHDTAVPLNPADLPASFQPGELSHELLLQEPAAKPLARDLDRLIRQVGNLAADYRFACYWGAPWPPDEAPQTVGPATPAELSHQAKTAFDLELPSAYLEHLDRAPGHTPAPPHATETPLRLLTLGELIDDNRLVRNTPALDRCWQPSWWAVADNTWGDLFFIDTHDPAPLQVYVLEHGLALEPDHDPKQTPRFASLDDLAQAAR